MKNSTIFTIIVAATLISNLLTAQPSQAYTWEEFNQTVEEVGKASGVWQRFMQDLERTRRGSSPRTPQPTPRRVEPEIQPQQPAGNDDWIQEPETQPQEPSGNEVSIQEPEIQIQEPSGNDDSIQETEEVQDN